MASKEERSPRRPEEPLLSHQLSSIGPETPGPEHEDPQASSMSCSCLGDGTFLQFLLYLFMPMCVYGRKKSAGQMAMRFKRHDETVPLCVNIFLGLQHAVLALGQIAAYALLWQFAHKSDFDSYTLQSATIIAGIATIFQALEIKIPYTNFQIGTGLTSILGSSIVMSEVSLNLIGEDPLSSPMSKTEAFGRILGTAPVCGLLFLILASIPRKFTKYAFPRVVTGTVTIIIGLEALKSSYVYWGGGQECHIHLSPICLFNGDIQLDYGKHIYIGLGMFVLAVFLLIELFGSGFLRHNILLFASIVVYIVTTFVTYDGNHYVTGDQFKDAMDVTFLWTTRYSLKFEPKIVIQLLMAYLIIYVESMVLLSATAEESGIDSESPEGDKRIQGGLIVTALAGILAPLGTSVPVTPVPQNTTLIPITKIASKDTAIACGIWLFIFGFLPKTLAISFLEVPMAVRGGIFAIVCAGIIMTGVKVLIQIQWNRRITTIVLFTLAISLGNTLVGDFIGEPIWDNSYENDYLECLRKAILFAIGKPFFLGAVVASFLNLILPKDMDLGRSDEIPE